MKTVVRLYENYDEAERTIAELANVGLDDRQIGLLTSAAANRANRHRHMNALELGEVGSVAANDRMLRLLDSKRGNGVLGALVALGIPHGDAASFVAGVRAGNTLEVVTIEDDKEAETVSIMQKRSFVASGANEEVVPIVKEDIKVGKRERAAGGVKVTTHVTTRPIDQTIAVREERVRVERHPVDREADCADDAFRDRVVEMKATAERPVVTKRARVVEEIRVHKDVSEHVETVRDTIRHTEVRVDQVAGDDVSELEPAYQFGEQLANDSRGASWAEMSVRAKSLWEATHPGTWARFEDAIRFGWNR
ncbi:MAG TPA: YsnF/AvaK domain-containing protein, partial [Kofleriaceae bacterium]|nr:YsnF/AvaK domain-containing protein [Kofleriaceae bacterium]